MLETNEKYMSQKELAGILSKTFEYNPSQKELRTKVLYDTYYIYLVGSLLTIISMASAGLKTDKKYGHEKSTSFKMSFIAEARERISEIYSIKSRPVTKNPNLRDLNLGDYNLEIAFFQYRLKSLKEEGGCADFMKPYFKEFVKLYKSLPKPILLKD